jgi:hypothetical protein
MDTFISKKLSYEARPAEILPFPLLKKKGEGGI